jgi:hypothetical protein
MRRDPDRVRQATFSVDERQKRPPGNKNEFATKIHGASTWWCAFGAANRPKYSSEIQPKRVALPPTVREAQPDPKSMSYSRAQARTVEMGWSAPQPLTLAAGQGEFNWKWARVAISVLQVYGAGLGCNSILPPFLRFFVANAYESKEQSGIIRRQFRGARREAAIFRGPLKSVAGLPRVSLFSQISAADVAIIVLFAFGGLAGFPGFPKYSDIKTQIVNLDYKPVWACLLFAFNYLLFYRKIRKCYFSAWVARLHAFMISAFVAMASVIVAKLSFLSNMNAVEALIAVQSGLAAVYLIVQGWVDFKPDLGSLAKLSKEIDSEARYIEGLYGEMVKYEHVKRISDLCTKFARDTDAALSDCSRDPAAQSKLSMEKNRVDKIFQALKAPLAEVPKALRRAKEPQITEGSEHA